MLEAILSSKFYKSSTRKEKILAAYNNPVNSELVKQLTSSLDDKYKQKLVQEVREDKEKQEKLDARVPDSALEFKENEKYSNPEPSRSRASESRSTNDSLSPTPTDKQDEPAAPAEDNIDSSDIDTNSSTYTRNKQRVVASLVRNESITAEQLSDEVKGILNLKDTTEGVARTSVKDEELWIYYNDNINLNNIMSEVIETLNSADYTFLIFNRLARTDNAIVFEISAKGGNNDQSITTEG